jgi:hypothetical protein
LKVRHENLLSSFASNFNLRRYITAQEVQIHDATTQAATLKEELTVLAVRPGRQRLPCLRPAF